MPQFAPAAAYLGEVPGPDGTNPERNLPMAKHAIDLLTVLEEKTKGNLSSEEEQILESLLFDLRLRTPRLELRLPTDDDLLELMRVAREGVVEEDGLGFVFGQFGAVGEADEEAELLALAVGGGFVDG